MSKVLNHIDLIASINLSKKIEVDYQTRHVSTLAKAGVLDTFWVFGRVDMGGWV